MTIVEWLMMLNGLGWGVVIGLILGGTWIIHRLKKYGRFAGFKTAEGHWYCPTCDKDYEQEEYYDCEHEKEFVEKYYIT